MVQIVQASTAEELAQVKELALEFLQWVIDRYPEDRAQLEAYFENQKVYASLDNLPGVYGPPSGCCLLALVDGRPAGIVMFKDYGGGTCEMNRMYVAPHARGHGVAQALVGTLMQRAREIGYDRMILVAAYKHHEALPFYRKMGFALDDTIPDNGGGDIEVRMSQRL